MAKKRNSSTLYCRYVNEKYEDCGCFVKVMTRDETGCEPCLDIIHNHKLLINTINMSNFLYATLSGFDFMMKKSEFTFLF